MCLCFYPYLGTLGNSLTDGGGMLAGHEECAGEAVGQLFFGSCVRALGSWDVGFTRF